jgi:peptidoglycan/LPS O-acetylase OafA/YrhL
MKRAILVFVIAALVLLTTGLWYFSSAGKMETAEIAGFGVILALAVFALFMGFRKLSSARRGEPVEDEMSKKVMVRASSLSYFISLYMWVFVIYINDRVDIDTEVLIGSGVLGMAVIFALTWLIVHFRGMRNG